MANISSELYTDLINIPKKTASQPNNVISVLNFTYPVSENTEDKHFNDKINKGVVEIEHKLTTTNKYLGLQIWHSSLLLTDYVLHLGNNGYLRNANVLEMGSGTGLTSVVAGMFAKSIVCTDINDDTILGLIRTNYNLNKKNIKAKFVVKPFDFTKSIESDINVELSSINTILIADVIFLEDLTALLMNTLLNIMNIAPAKTIYMAVHKRNIFITSYNAFMKIINDIKKQNKFTLTKLPIDFPKCFSYERINELELWKLSTKKS